jgi:hypothetical protein
MTQTVLSGLGCVHKNYCQLSYRKRTIVFSERYPCEKQMERIRPRQTSNTERYFNLIGKTIVKNVVNFRLIHLTCFSTSVFLTLGSTIVVTKLLNIVGSEKLLPTILQTIVTIKPLLNCLLSVLFQAITYY